MKQYTTEELWRAVEVLESAFEYLQASEVDKPDPYLSDTLDEACQILVKLTRELLVYVSRREQQ